MAGGIRSRAVMSKRLASPRPRPGPICFLCKHKQVVTTEWRSPSVASDLSAGTGLCTNRDGASGASGAIHRSQGIDVLRS